MTTMFDELLRLRNEFEKVAATWSRGVYPPVNIYDDGECYLVRTEIPGMDKSALEVTVKNNQLTLGGQRSVQRPTTDAAHHRREREGGKFRRTVTLPDSVDSTKIQATYKNGVLEVVVPRAPEARQRRIEIG